MKKILCFLVGMYACSGVMAGTNSGNRNVINIGCHKNDNICFITIDGSPVGPEGCNSNSVRWEAEKDASGKSALSLFSAAYFSGKKVELRVSDICFQYQNSFPTFDWFYIVD